MKQPNTLTVFKLTVPLSLGLLRFKHIRERKSETEDPVILEGVFALSLATFETCLSDTLKVILKAAPEKLGDNPLTNIPKEIIIAGEGINWAVENRIQNRAYKSLEDFLKYFEEITGVDGLKDENIFNVIQEAKATRNLLMHNNLKSNFKYEETAGKNIRSKNHAGFLDIDNAYLLQTLNALEAIMIDYKKKLEFKYKDHTYIRAMNNLWDFLFSSPILKFGDVWEVDTERDRLVKYIGPDMNGTEVSSSEKVLLKLWHNHLNFTWEPIEHFSFYSLDNKNVARISYLMKIVDLLKENQNGKK